MIYDPERLNSTTNTLCNVIKNVSSETSKSIQDINDIFKKEINYSQPLRYSVNHVVQVLRLPEKEVNELREVYDRGNALLFHEAKVIPFKRADSCVSGSV